MIVLYGDPCSVFVRKARILLLEKGIEFISDPIDLYNYSHEKFKQASPLNKIPALRDGDFTLADSSVICAYIEKKFPFPSFYPDTAEEYAKALWYEEYADTVLFQAIAPIYYQTILSPKFHHREPDRDAIDNTLAQKLPQVLKYLDTILINKSFLVADVFTIADVSVLSMFMNMYLSGFPLNARDWPNLSRYLHGQFQRESFKICAEDFKNINSEFL